MTASPPAAVVAVAAAAEQRNSHCLGWAKQSTSDATLQNYGTVDGNEKNVYFSVIGPRLLRAKSELHAK
jgi:hypothetical protein